MKHFLLTLLLTLVSFISFAQDLGNLKLGASFGLASDATLAAEATLAWPMNYMFDIAANAEFEQDYSNVYASLNTNISSIFFGDHFRYFELWAVTGIGWGHDFRKQLKVDHNFHTYNLALIGSYRPTLDWSIHLKPMLVWRDWQGSIRPRKYHPVITIGFTKMF